jgi:hypothetical protein
MTTSASYPRNGAAPATPPSPSGPSSATWAVHEAPTSCCMRWKIGTMEMTYTMRGADEAEVSARLQHALPWLLTVVTSLENKGIPPALLPWDPGTLPAAPEDWCPRHRVTMDHHRNTQGEWYSHRLDDGTYCKGK